MKFLRADKKGGTPVCFSGTGRAAGFTIVEMMAAVTVLGLIMLMLVQISGSMVRATSASQKQMEATRQARAVLDTLRDDLDNLVVENNASTIFVKVDGNNNAQLVFVTRRRGPQGATDLRYLAVRYSMDEVKENRLIRGVSEIAWKDVDLMGKAFQAPSPDLTSVIGDGVLRFEVVALLDDGKLVPLDSAGLWHSSTWQEVQVPSQFTALNMAEGAADPSNPKVRALTVAVATLDEKSLRLPDAGKISLALDAAAAGETPLEIWSGVINSGGLSSYPAPAVAALRVLQRTLPVP